MTLNLSHTLVGPQYNKVLVTDLDGTLLIPDKDNMKKNFEGRIIDISCPNKVISSVKSSGVDSVMISTGRNIDELGEVGYLLRKLDLPYSAIALEDGKRLFVKPNGMPAQH